MKNKLKLIKIKQPYIKNMKEFLMLAFHFGFTLYQDYTLQKTLYYKDSDVNIIIDIHTGLIEFEYFDDDLLIELPLEDKQYLMRDFEHYVIWK